jgi:hypothetical protein
MKHITNDTRLYLLVAIMLSSYFILHADPVVVSGGLENDYESWILRLNDDRLMVIFDRNPDWQSGDLYVTFSTNNGTTWDSVVPIIEDFGDQATLSFVQLPTDTIRLWYASNESGTYGIYTAYSLNGIAWTKQGLIDLGWSPGVMHFDPTVILESDSSLTMSYRGPGGGYITHCPYAGTWDTLKTLVAPSGYRPRVMKHENGTYLYAYHRKSGQGTYDYDVFIRTSTDRVNWSDSVRLTDNLNSHDPFPNQTPDGAYLVYYAKYEPPAYNLHCRRSYNTINWETEEQITSDPTNNTQPHFFIEPNELYLIWAHAVTFPDDHDVYFERFSYPGVEETDSGIVKKPPISVRLSPNPCTDHITILLHAQHTSEVEISLFNVLGQLINTQIKKISCGTTPFLMSTSSLSNGTYFVNIDYSQGQILDNFIVVH